MVIILCILALSAFFGPAIASAGKKGGVLLAMAPASGLAWLLGRAFAASPYVSYGFSVPWIDSLGVRFALHVDGLSWLMAALVLGVGTLILLYTSSYLAWDRDLDRFNSTLMIFMTAMLGLVLADDALLFFVFWEGTTLGSYLLVGYEHEDAMARISARKALVITGTGGLAILGGLVILHAITGTWSIQAWIAQAEVIRAHPWGMVAFACIALGAFTKSAQFPFHFWLPAAMAGPTPVSAYLHSATMVKAGVYLLARFAPIWSGTEAWKWTLVPIGALTMLASAWAGIRERDIKSMLAYTTTMALGLLVMMLGVGDEAAVVAAVAYLVTHAFYKGAAFMWAGIVDHGTGTRDVGALSGLRRTMPFTAVAAILSCASMAGLPPFVGFVAKESAYEASLHAGALGSWVTAAAVGANVALFAVSGVLVAKVFFGKPSPAAEKAHEGDWALLLGPLTLAGLGLAAGLFPSLLSEPVGAAATAIVGHPVHPHFQLWHGVTEALWASAATFACGFAIYAVIPGLRESAALGAFHAAFTRWPGRAFERLLMGAARVSTAINAVIYSGRSRSYVKLTLTSVGLCLGALFLRERITFPTLDSLPLPHEWVLLATLVVSSALASFIEPAMRAIIAVGISGYCVALIYLLYGAPDVAMTQFAIETLNVILVVLTLLHLPEAAYEKSRPRARWLDAALATAVGAALAVVMLGVLSGTLPTYVSDWYLSHSVPDAHGHNVVNVILVDFRGYDTWGEITVLTISGLGVYALLRKRARWRHEALPPAAPGAGVEES